MTAVSASAGMPLKDGRLEISPGGGDPEGTRHSAEALYNELTTSTQP